VRAGRYRVTLHANAGVLLVTCYTKIGRKLWSGSLLDDGSSLWDGNAWDIEGVAKLIRLWGTKKTNDT
jgi:hypothetical protein